MTLIPHRLQALPQVQRHNWLIHAIMLDFLEGAASRYAQGVPVDIGCGTKPYAPVFARYITRHIGVDLEDSVHGTAAIDVIGTAYATNLADASCDVVLCTEVLEHLEKPQQAVEEMHRILKPGGTVILTVPFFWPIHEAPRDFYRYSEFGLRYLFEAGGFELIEVRPLTGYIATFTQLSIYYLLRFQRGVLRYPGAVLNGVLQQIAWWLNPFDKSYTFTNLYGLVAQRK